MLAVTSTDRIFGERGYSVRLQAGKNVQFRSVAVSVNWGRLNCLPNPRQREFTLNRILVFIRRDHIMNKQYTGRRQFLQGAAGVLAGSVLASARNSTAQVPEPLHSIRLGAPVYDAPEDPEALARLHRDLGYRAAYCPQVELNDKERIRDISRAYAKHDVVIAEVGRWCNLLDVDPKKRADKPANCDRWTGTG